MAWRVKYTKTFLKELAKLPDKPRQHVEALWVYAWI